MINKTFQMLEETVGKLDLLNRIVCTKSLFSYYPPIALFRTTRIDKGTLHQYNDF